MERLDNLYVSKVSNVSEERENRIMPVSLCLSILLNIQSGASSPAKHGGAYFSAVRASIKDPIAVPGWHEVPGV